MHIQTKTLPRGVRVIRARMPLLVTAAWVASERLILVDERLADRDACAAIVDVLLARREQVDRKEAT